MRRNHIGAAILFCLVLAACRTESAPDPIDGPPRELAEPATTLRLRSGPAKGSPGARPTTGATVGSSPGATFTTAPAKPFTTIATATDASGDAGLQAPGYADLRASRLASNGPSLRVTVTMGAVVPNPMPAGEQMAIGVDLYGTAGERESDYQLYASGTEDGWLAYLTAPDGFVEYPGTFAIGGRVLQFTVPWASLGDIRGSEFSAFMDWDRERPVLNQAGQDSMERARFSR